MLVNILSILIFLAELVYQQDFEQTTSHVNNCKYHYNTSLKKNIYTTFDEKPEFPGGQSSYQRFLIRHASLPNSIIDSLDNTTPITVILTIDSTGLIIKSNIHPNDASRQLSPLEKEALRLVGQMPKWTPGKCHGRPVTVEYIFPMWSCLKLEE